MSLQVWLPLNGDLHNQGLSNNIITKTVVFNNNGKIGSCLESTSLLNLNVPQSIYDVYSISDTEISYCLWIKIDKAYLNNLISTTDFSAKTQIYNKIMGFDNGSTSNGIGLHLRTNAGLTQSTVLNTILVYGYLRNSSVGDGSAATEINLDQWYHLCITYDKLNIFKFYINGSLIASKTINRANLHTSISDKIVVLNSKTCQLASSSSQNVHLLNLKEYINDVRIYNHALSPKEVEEIAKGLVLHYPLNNSANNISWLLPNSETTITRASKNTTVDYNYYPDLITNSETSYIVDFYAKGSVSAMTMDVYFRDSSGAYALTSLQTLTTAWKHYSLPLSGSPSSLQLFRARCYGGTAGDFISIRNMRLLSNNIPIRMSTIYDCSGYSHNGTIVGSLTAAASSPRYDVATTFPTKDDYFYFPHLVDSTAMNNEFTFSCWLYRDYTDAASKYIYYGLCAIYLSSSFKPCISWTHASEDLSYNQNNAYAPSAAPVIPLQTWTHLVWVFQNGVLYCYINGQQTARDNRSSNGTYIRGTRGSDASIGYTWIGKISDVRTYATALTAEQVKELYNTSMSVDSNGNVYARELVEL